jgi:arylsulfatase A
MRRFALLVLVTVVGGGAWHEAGAAEPPLHRRPNIVVILADDFGYECVGANGGGYATPHLDRLAAGGVRFTSCHVQPLCTPTRAELLTGKSNKRNYVDFGSLPPTETTFAHLLRDAGYATAVAGKWQLGTDPGSPRHFGFDSACTWNHTRRAPRYANPGLDFDGVPRDFAAGEYGPDLVSDFALAFVERVRDRPFLLYYPLMLTHGPFQPTPLDPDWDPRAIGEKVNDRPRHFPGMVAYLDRLVGRLVGRLEALGLRENTLIVFVGDNGTAPAITGTLDGRPFRGGKGSTTHRGTHVPLIVSWPAVIKAPRVCGDLIAAVDILPTVCAAAGVAVPAGGDGTSFLPQLAGERGTPRDWIHAWYRPRLKRGAEAREHAFDHHHKLYADGRLYDLAADPEEKTALAEGDLTAKQRAGRAKLAAALERYADARPAELRRIDETAPAGAGSEE